MKITIDNTPKTPKYPKLMIDKFDRIWLMLDCKSAICLYVANEQKGCYSVGSVENSLDKHDYMELRNFTSKLTLEND